MLGSNLSRGYTRNRLNQYTNVAGSAFNYDARGNLISDGARAGARLDDQPGTLQPTILQRSSGVVVGELVGAWLNRNAQTA